MVKLHRPGRFYFPRRYVAALLGFLGEACLYSMQVSLNMSLLAMSRGVREERNNNGTRPTVECPMLVEREEKEKTAGFQGASYEWDAREQSVILQAFYYGYILTQIPGGFLAQVFSPKWIFGAGALISALLCLLTPAAAALGPNTLIAVRVMQGLAQGVGKPSMYALIGQWSPKMERSRFSTFLMTGGQAGSVVALPVSGLISSCALLGGWPAVFSFFGVLSCIWFVFWTWFMYDSPRDHPSISTAELQLYQRHKGRAKKPHPVPWRAILRSWTVWSVIAAHFGNGFGFLTLFTELPNYLENVLHFDIRENGLTSAVPYVVQALAGWMAAYAADGLRENGRLGGITGIRKAFNSIGFYGPAVFLMCVTAVGCRPKAIVGLLSFAMAFNGFSYSGFNVTFVDISPEFAGTLFGISNTASSICGILAPALVGYLTSDGETIVEWNRVFYAVSVVYVSTGTFYNVFASAEPHSFGVSSEDDDDTEMELMPNECSE